MEKTAMQELIDSYVPDGNPERFLQKAKDLLTKERQQIEDAFNAGTKARYVKGLELLGISHLPEGVETGAEYFTKKYGL